MGIYIFIYQKEKYNDGSAVSIAVAYLSSFAWLNTQCRFSYVITSES
jgi:hypothetical protein